MKNKTVKRIMAVCVCGMLLAGCGNKETVQDTSASVSTDTESSASTDTAGDGQGQTGQMPGDNKPDNFPGDNKPGNVPGGFESSGLTTDNNITADDLTAKSDKLATSWESIEGATVITLNTDSATVNGEAVPEYDYKWCIDPSKEKPWYEGTEPSGEDSVYIAHDIVYYPELDADSFVLEEYDGEQEWVYKYTAEGLEQYNFSTLPSFMGTSEVPTEMMHTAEEAYENKVLHITKAGVYVLEGDWHGQIYIDLGDKDDTFTDENAKVTIYLNGVNVTCDVNSSFIAYSAYECDNEWENRSEYSGDVDTSDAGVNVVICDGTKNNFTGANVYRLLKAAYKSEGSTKQKKLYKVDGAFYSFVSMNITGEENDTGILNIISTTFEGLDTELHLTINGGNITIYSKDDGINVNEDDVSVFTMNGGTLHVFAALGREGDCIDSNGYATVNGGIIAAGTPSSMDEVIDTNNGCTVNGGTVISVGSSEMSMGSFNPGNFGGQNPPSGGFGDMQVPEGMPEGFDPQNMTPPTNN